jgi:hypothetical protein
VVHTQRSDAFKVSAIWNEWSEYAVFAKKVQEVDGRWMDPGPLTCPAPRPAQ